MVWVRYDCMNAYEHIVINTGDRCVYYITSRAFVFSDAVARRRPQSCMVHAAYTTYFIRGRRRRISGTCVTIRRGHIRSNTIVIYLWFFRELYYSVQYLIYLIRHFFYVNIWNFDCKLYALHIVNILCNILSSYIITCWTKSFLFISFSIIWSRKPWLLILSWMLELIIF